MKATTAWPRHPITKPWGVDSRKQCNYSSPNTCLDSGRMLQLPPSTFCRVSTMSKTCVLILFASLVAFIDTAAHAQSIFPDKNLEAAVRRYVFEKRNNDMPLTEEDVVNISTIQGNNKGIKSLAGMEKCRSLALLDLEGNEVEDLGPIKELKNIQSLTLTKNKIKDAKPIEGLVKLQYLQLSENQIADLAPLAKLEALRSLYLSRNRDQGRCALGRFEQTLVAVSRWKPDRGP